MLVTENHVISTNDGAAAQSGIDPIATATAVANNLISRLMLAHSGRIIALRSQRTDPAQRIGLDTCGLAMMRQVQSRALQRREYSTSFRSTAAIREPRRPSTRSTRASAGIRE